ncbi:12720_t:CDS:1 [Acaulospora morrowiae]|uniref:12720_t:CDS:1 n=1 Tax=Acaulospora morrowiae TaxID=94023 RepID=A0A9N9EAT2_9GLOM|nr:12720_t:CDS:1 [Acaulospora morrowiae]
MSSPVSSNILSHSLPHSAPSSVPTVQHYSRPLSSTSPKNRLMSIPSEPSLANHRRRISWTPSTHKTKHAQSTSSLVLISESKSSTEAVVTSKSSVSLDSSLPFPYEKIQKRHTSRKIRALSYNRSYNSQPSPIEETIEPNFKEHSKTNANSPNNSISSSSHPGGVFGWFRKRVLKDTGKGLKSLKNSSSKQDSILGDEKFLDEK